MSLLMNKFKEFWQLRNPRERIYLTVCAGFVAIALLWAGVWQPLSEANAKLRKQVPQMQLQLAELQRQLAQVKATPASPGRSGDFRSAIQASLDAQNTSADIQVLSAEKIQIKIARIRFAEALPLLAALRSETGSRITSLQISGQEHNGLVQLSAQAERQ